MLDTLMNVKGLLVHGRPAPQSFSELVGEAWKGDVLVTEGRPQLNGARRTTLVMLSHGYVPTLVSDNMVAYCMWKGMAQAALICYSEVSGSSLVCPIGSLGVALCASFHQVPVFAVPMDIVPKDSEDTLGSDHDDLVHFMHDRVAVEGVATFEPGADLVPLEWVHEVRS